MQGHLLLQFQYEQRLRTKEKCYIDFVKKMMKLESFRTLWEKAQLSVTKDDIVVPDYSRSIVIPASEPDRQLDFHLFSVPLLEDRRSHIEFHVPANLETYNYFLKK